MSVDALRIPKILLGDPLEFGTGYGSQGLVVGTGYSLIILGELPNSENPKIFDYTFALKQYLIKDEMIWELLSGMYLV